MQLAYKTIKQVTAGHHEYEYTARDFNRIRRLIYQRAGICLSGQKSEMVYNRLVKRLRKFGMTCFDDYLNMLEQGNEQEWDVFVGLLTTHLTSFFRESYHFPILVEHVSRQTRKGKVLLWSCAASTGEEPYTMAIALAEHFESPAAVPVKILATDVDSGVLDVARTGVYPVDRITHLPDHIIRKYFLRGEGKFSGYAKVRPEIQEMICFNQLNLLSDSWPMKEKFDAIFCRNVMIYFDRQTQEKVLSKCQRHLKPDGLFFAGHSENLHYASALFQPCGKTVYRPLSAPDTSLQLKEGCA